MTKQEKLWLTAHALGVSTSEILSRKNFSDEEEKKIRELLSRREVGEPLQYIMGQADFYGRDFFVGPGVLIPRHDTETLIEAAKKIFPPEKNFSFLDWGTGSGCIAITLLLEFKNSRGVMLEQSPEALNYAEKNLQRYGLEDRASLNDSSTKIFDLIISNPPYIPSHEIDSLMPEVKNYEPRLALDGGEDGMNFYRLILSQARRILKPEGFIIFELGDLNQYRAFKNSGGEFLFAGEIFDGGNFPRAIILRKRHENF